MEQPPIEKLGEWPFIITLVITTIILFVKHLCDDLRKRDFVWVLLIGAALYGLQLLLGTDRFVFIAVWVGGIVLLSHLTTPKPHPITRIGELLKKSGEQARLVDELSEARSKMDDEKKEEK